MPIDPEFIEILRSPDTRKPLRPADAGELARINELIKAGQAKNRAGTAVTEALEQGLVPEGESIVYPVRDEIPILLTDEAIPFGTDAGDGQG